MKTGSRKINVVPLLLFLLLFPSGRLFSQALDVSVERGPKDSALTVDCSVRDMPEEILNDSIDRGFQVEAAYTFRTYRKNTGFFSFLGDRLIEDREVVLTGEYDPFERMYVVTGDYPDGRFQTSDRDKFISALLTLRNQPLFAPAADGREYYILARAEISPIKLKPPLTILAFLSQISQYHTAWHKLAIPSREITS